MNLKLITLFPFTQCYERVIQQSYYLLLSPLAEIDRGFGPSLPDLDLKDVECGRKKQIEFLIVPYGTDYFHTKRNITTIAEGDT